MKFMKDHNVSEHKVHNGPLYSHKMADTKIPVAYGLITSKVLGRVPQPLTSSKVSGVELPLNQYLDYQKTVIETANLSKSAAN